MTSVEFNLTRIDRLRYRPTLVAEDFLDSLRRALLPETKAVVARLAIGRSLSQPGDLAGLPDSSKLEMGKPIAGQHLLGEDADLWACLIAASVKDPPKTDKAFRLLVENHWHRGALLLKQDYEEAGKNDVDFVARLAAMLPEPAGRSGV